VLIPSKYASIAHQLAPAAVRLSLNERPLKSSPSQATWQRASMCVIVKP
jgi:hypothetical protein